MMYLMRTTITLEPDLDERLRQMARESGISFKAAINLVIRRGLAPEVSQSEPFTVSAKPMGLRPGIDLDKALALAERLEDEETIRKLELRK